MESDAPPSPTPGSPTPASPTSTPAEPTSPKPRRIAPPWANDTKCGRCNLKFSLMRRRHHCRNCGFSICNTCSSERKLPVPDFGYFKPGIWCRQCYSALSPEEITGLFVTAKSAPSGEGGGGGGGGGGGEGGEGGDSVEKLKNAASAAKSTYDGLSDDIKEQATGAIVAGGKFLLSQFGINLPDDAPKDDAPKSDAPKADDAPKDDAPKDDAPKDPPADDTSSSSSSSPLGRRQGQLIHELGEHRRHQQEDDKGGPTDIREVIFTEIQERREDSNLPTRQTPEPEDDDLSNLPPYRYGMGSRGRTESAAEEES